ncbi:CAP domain-containing protein [Streptomyces sp. NPDC055085]
MDHRRVDADSGVHDSPTPRVSRTPLPMRPSHTATTTPHPVSITETLRQKLITARGGSPLSRYSGMDATVQAWADEMARTNTLAHRPILTPYHGEIIASGATDTATAMTLWLGSPPHRQIILNTTFTRVGIGYNAGYWCVVFS